MGSYVISVSLYTGCYRHIRIQENATLWKLHEIIQSAFEFDDDHLHAFFLDNCVWSRERAYYSERLENGKNLTKSCTLKKAGLKPGVPFKYVFDFGDEWVFQCRVLRYIEEPTDIPCIVRSVGAPPEQYPDAEYYDEEGYDEDEEVDEEEDEDDQKLLEEWKRSLPKVFSEKELQDGYASLPMSKRTVEKLRRYCTAVARIYGITPVTLAYELYCKYEQPLAMEDYLAFTEVLRHDDRFGVFVLGKESLFRIEEPSAPEDREIIYDFLLLGGPPLYYHITDQRRTKTQFQPSLEELLRYADVETIPNTPQAQAMLEYLDIILKNEDTATRLTRLLISMIAADYPMDGVWTVLQDAGIKLEINGLTEFQRLYQALDNHTRKFMNNGFTPWELSRKAQQEQQKNCKEQLSLF